jgi:hypothetical protein
MLGGVEAETSSTGAAARANKVEPGTAGSMGAAAEELVPLRRKGAKVLDLGAGVAEEKEDTAESVKRLRQRAFN